MTRPTPQHDEAIRQLTRLGWVEDPPLGGLQARVFNHRDRPYKMFVTPRGELRMGTTWEASWPLFDGSLERQLQWLRDTMVFCAVGGTLPTRKQLVKLGAAPKLRHSDEDIA